MVYMVRAVRGEPPAVIKVILLRCQKKVENVHLLVGLVLLALIIKPKHTLLITARNLLNVLEEMPLSKVVAPVPHLMQDSEFVTSHLHSHAKRRYLDSTRINYPTISIYLILKTSVIY